MNQYVLALYIYISFRFKSDFDLSFQHRVIIESDGGTSCGLVKITRFGRLSTHNLCPFHKFSYIYQFLPPLRPLVSQSDLAKILMAFVWPRWRPQKLMMTYVRRGTAFLFYFFFLGGGVDVFYVYDGTFFCWGMVVKKAIKIVIACFFASILAKLDFTKLLTSWWNSIHDPCRLYRHIKASH